jgi:hypothetical protein
VKNVLRLGLVLALSSSVAIANATTTLRFDQYPGVDASQELQGMGNDLFIKGFRLAYSPAPAEPYPVGFTAVGRSWPFNGRSVAVAANSCGATTTLTRDDNNPFGADAIDFAALNGDPEIRVRMVGVKPDGTQVTHEIINKKANWKTFDLPRAFESLISLTWWQGDCIANPPHMFDNIHLEKKVKKTAQ